MALKPPEEKTTLQRYLPIVDWLPRYEWGKWLRLDMMAALTVWALLVPEAMAYAGIAGVPPEVGLVTAPLALVGYAIFGSSKHLFVGPSSTVAIISASVVAPLAGSDGDLYLILTIWLAIFTGVFFIGLGMARMGWIANFMASSVLTGFMVGLAIVIATGQLDKILGVESEGGNVLQEFGSMFEQFSDWDWPTIVVGVVALAALFLIEEYASKLPGALIVMLVAIAASAIFDFEGSGIHVVGEIPAELPNLSLPEWQGWDIMGDIMVGALAVIVVAFAESYAAAKTYASKFGYQVDANQEMIGLGAANLGAGLSGGFVVDGSLSKTAAGVDAGQKSQMTSIITAILVLITIVALTWLFEPLPEAVLGAIVIHAVWKLIDFSGFVTLWKERRIDFTLALAAFLGVILIDILQGIMIGIILSLVALIYRDSFPEGSELGRVEDEEGHYEFVGIDNNPDAQILREVVIYRQTGSLIFSNASAFSQQARELLWKRTDPPAKVLIVDCEQMADMDITGAEEIVALSEELQAADVDLLLARLRGDARVTADRTGVTAAIGEDRVLPSVRAARQALADRGIDWDHPRAAGDNEDQTQQQRGAVMAETFPEAYTGNALTTDRVVVRDASAVLKAYPDKYVAGSEELAADEIRVTALGTGYPARRAQGCAGFMMELGNDDVFIFDAGAGTNLSFNTLRVPYWKASKFFITHYHLDHIADLPVYYDFGQSNGRLEPMHIHGPGGETPELGIEALVDNIYRFARWHDRTKLGNLDPRGFDMQAHEFVPDEAKVVYESNGVTITAFPVPHGIYGAVGYRLDYAGMSVVYAGDCEPSTITVDNAQDVDLLIHEIFNPPETYVEEMGWPEVQAKIVAWTKHTSPEAAAKVFGRTNPGIAMGFHAIVAPGTPQPILDGVRSGYDGPFTLAADYTVVNVTPQQIVTRMTEVVPWDYIVTDPAYVERMGGSNPDPSVMHGLPGWLEDTVIPVAEIEEFKKQLGEMGAR